VQIERSQSVELANIVQEMESEAASSISSDEEHDEEITDSYQHCRSP
jgi:hypothetical protein